MKAEREDYKQAIERLRLHLQNFSKGDRISYDDVGKLIGFEYGTQSFKYITRKFRWQDAREQLRFTLKCDRGVGFVIMSDDETVDFVTIENHKKARRMLKRVDKSSKTVDESNLSDTKRRLFHAGRDATKAVARELTRSVNHFKRESMPIRKVDEA